VPPPFKAGGAGPGVHVPLPFKAPPARPPPPQQQGADGSVPPAKRARGTDGGADSAAGQALLMKPPPFSGLTAPSQGLGGGDQTQDGTRLAPALAKNAPFSGAGGQPARGQGSDYHTVAGIGAPKQPGFQGSFSVQRNPLHGIQTKSSSLGIPVPVSVPPKFPAAPPPQHNGPPDWTSEWSHEEMEAERVYQEATWQQTMEQRRKNAEELRALKLQEDQDREERRRLEAETMALTLHGELSSLVEATEDQATLLKEMCTLSDPEQGRSAQEIVKLSEEFEAATAKARVAAKGCADFMAGKYLRLQGISESTRQGAAMLLKRFKQAERDIEASVGKVRLRKRDAVLTRDREIKRQAAAAAQEKQESLFKQYDRDEDGLLSAREVREFVKGECNFDLQPDKVEGILKSEAFAGSPGVTREKFPQLRLLVGVAAVVGALSGMEVEVAKAEEKARPLTNIKGRASLPHDMLEERTDEVDAAVDSARDYLAAAREQFQTLESEQMQGAMLPTAPQAVKMAVAEARKLGARLDWFEQRLTRAGSASKASRDRLLLQRKKEALMREADAALRFR